MKRILLASLVALASIGAADPVHANLLANGNLDLTITGGAGLPIPDDFVVESTRGGNPFNDGLSSEVWNNVNPGGSHGIMFKPFQGNQPATPNSGRVTANLYQDVPATAGWSYLLAGYFGAQANYSGLLPNSLTKSEFALEFLNASNAVIGGTTLDLKAAGLYTNSTGPNYYHQYSVSGTAPAGTVNVRARGSMIDGYWTTDPGQVFLTDAWDLTVSGVPEPSSLALAAAALGAITSQRGRRR